MIVALIITNLGVLGLYYHTYIQVSDKFKTHVKYNQLEKLSTIIKNNRILIFFSVFAILIIVLESREYLNTEKEHAKSYHFVISKIDKAANGFKTFYDKENKISFLNFHISDTVCSGDSISKEKYAKYMNVYRKSINGNYELLTSIRGSGNFGIGGRNRIEKTSH